MHLDVQDLRDFYYRSVLGHAARRVIRNQVNALWPPQDVARQSIVGFGYALPVLRPYLKCARRVIALMPGPQGVMPWPASQPNISALCSEERWPLETGHTDRLILLHGLETSERPVDVLSEAYRVLGPGGRALFILPNRSGLWARAEHTPFGYGRPYSISQLETQLRQNDFIPEQHVSVLFQPPSTRRFWMKTAPVWERMGRAIPAVMAGGVMMVVASKCYPPKRKGSRSPARVLNPLGVLSPEAVSS